MNAITLGNPNLFVKGMVEAVITDPQTGNIIGYDNVASESAVTTSVNLGEVTGGAGNPLLINIPDTTRISGTLTSQAFSLQQRSLMTGGNLRLSGGIVSVCETIVAPASGGLVVTNTPAKAYGQSAEDTTCWCYVREHGSATYVGTNYGVDSTTKTVANFTPVAGTYYDVFYFTAMDSAQVLELPSNFNPKVATIRLKYGVYAKQNNKVSNGTLQGYLYFIVPRAQFTGDAGISANQTSNSTTNYDWQAITPDRNMMDCVDCGGSDEAYAYYIYCPCNEDALYDNVSGIVAIPVTGLNGDVGPFEAQIPLYLILSDGTTATPNYTDFTYSPTSGDISGDGTFTVSNSGVVSVSGTTAQGTFEITITSKKKPSLTTKCPVTVSY